MDIRDPFNAAALARAAALEDAKNPEVVGDLLSLDFDAEERVATYSFAGALPGYVGWNWAVTVIRLDDEIEATIGDVVLLPGEGALLAPEWIPYKDRLQPGDVGVGDIIPTSHDDERLVPGMSALPTDHDLDSIEDAQLFELGVGRARVLSIVGRDSAARRWHEGDRGPNTPLAQYAPKPCHTCGFFIPLSGGLSSAFGVCANALAPDDARVVSIDHGCGAHSEAMVVTD